MKTKTKTEPTETNVMDATTKEKLAELAKEYFDSNQSLKVMRSAVKTLKQEIEEMIVSLGISELDVDGIKFSLNTKSSKKFRKKDFALNIGVDKKEVNEVKIAELVEQEVTSSQEVGDFFSETTSHNFKIKKAKAKKAKKAK